MASEVTFLDGGSKLFIKNFVNFQYGELKENSKVHKSVISSLMRYNLFEGVSKGLDNPYATPKDKDKDKDKEKEKEKDKEKDKDAVFKLREIMKTIQ